MLDWSAKNISAPGDKITINVSTRRDLMADLEARLAAATGFTLATLNLDHMVKIKRDAAFRHAYARHSHVTADGRPVVWLSRLAGRRVELVPGSELVEPVAGIAARLGVPVAFLGSTEAALEAAESGLCDRLPGLKVAARIAPPMGFDPNGTGAEAAIEEIRASGARLCFLALGAPKQELFAVRAAQALPQVGFLSIGAGLDFIAGTQVRAPVLFRALAAEWLWRLASNPRRLAGRYAACFAILPGLAVDALTSRKGKS